jgi:hypothetical protein
VLLCASSRQFQKDGPWGFYCADEAAARHGASSPEDTQDGALAYARFAPRRPVRYREGLLPGMTETEIEHTLREAGAAFIEVHEQAARAIREAADAGMPAEAISHVSRLSPETVRAFLRAGAGE